MGKYVRTYKDNIIIDKEIAKKLKEFEILKKELEPIISEIRIDLKDYMTKLDKDKIVSNGVSANLVSAYTKNDFDKKKLQIDNPSLYAKYLKVVNVDSAIKLNIGI